jgi:hypothetical protein
MGVSGGLGAAPESERQFWFSDSVQQDRKVEGTSAIFAFGVPLS